MARPTPSVRSPRLPISPQWPTLTLTVMTVVPDKSSWNLGGAGFGTYVPIQTLEDLREQTERGYQGMLDAAVETLSRSDVSLTKVVDHGRPASRAVTGQS